MRTYNTSGGFLNASIGEVKERATQSLAEAIGGIKVKVGLPDSAEDRRRVAAVREHIGPDVPLPVRWRCWWCYCLGEGGARDHLNPRALVQRLDPDGIFANAFLRGVLSMPAASLQ